jgi:hypothetical protein
MKTLESLRALAVRAHNGTSFSPEKRGDSVVNDHSEELDQDIEKIKSQGASEEQVERYKSGYIEKLSKYLASQSNVVSTMIAGPANFPVRQMQKRNAWADNHYTTFREWRKKVLAAYVKYENKRKIENAGGPLEIAKKELESVKRLHQLSKDGNKVISKALKSGEDISTYLRETFNVKPHMIEYTMKFGFNTTNSLAKIKRLESRIKELEQKETRSGSENKEIPFEGGMCELNYQLDRVTIKHDQKPSSEVIKNLKSNGFKWSPNYGVWMRQLTQNALYSASRVLGIEIK